MLAGSESMQLQQRDLHWENMAPTARDFSSRHEPLPSQRPDNTAFTQQRLPAWQPLLTASIILPLFFFVGLSFIGIGIGLYYSSNNITESEYDYTGMSLDDPCYVAAHNGLNECNVTFNLTTPFAGPVFMYYELSNFYQNHYRYMISRDDKQLSGFLDNLKNPANECVPYRVNSEQKPIAPCGAIANSMFNDTITLYYYNSSGTYEEVPLNGKGIAWWTDYNIKFHNPTDGNKTLAQIFQALGIGMPLNWHVPAFNLSADLYNNGFINEDFIVWMRSAALPTFRKLYRRIESGKFAEGLPAGEYQLRIIYNYPVLSFGGRKKIVFSTVSWMGGKNPFLGIAYLVCGSLCTLFAIIMLIVYLKYQGKNDDIYLAQHNLDY